MAAATHGDGVQHQAEPLLEGEFNSSHPHQKQVEGVYMSS